MKQNVILVFLICTALSFFSCTKKEDKDIKVLNMSVGAKVKGMDPIYANDLYSSMEVAKVYEGLLEYHYLKRPFTLKPNLAEAMPTVSEDGLEYTFKIRKGVVFHNDPAFPEGKGRELVANDFIYSIKRLADPKLQGLGWWLLEGKIKGLNDWREASAKMTKTDYSAPVEGLQVIDKYTLKFVLAKPFPQFLYSLAMPFTFAVAKEVVDAYGKNFLNHPIGTGPFIIRDGEFKQSNRIVYFRNPTFRKKLYPSDASEKFVKMGYLEDAGKPLPLVDKIVVNIIEESQPAWLNFNKGKLDYNGIPKDNFDSAILPNKGLSEELTKKGIHLEVVPSLDVTYIGFNHDHILFKNNVNLRRAMSLAYDTDRSNELFYNNRSVPAQSVIPPGIAGNIPGWENPYAKFDVEKAKELLKEAGYPGGKGLPELDYDITSSTTARQMGEFFQKKMAAIGIKIKIQQNSWPELQKKLNTRNIMLWGMAWSADYPDAENFLQLLYGPNKAPGANGSDFQDDKFDAMFKKASVMQDSPERTKIYEEMFKYAGEQVPWIYGVHRQSYVISQKWLKNYLTSDFEAGREQFLNIDKKLKEEWIKKF